MSDQYHTDADFIEILMQQNKLLRAALNEARLQIEYLDAKFQATGTSAAVLVRIDAALSTSKCGDE